MRAVLCIILPLLLSAECAKILGVFPAPGYSQYILAEVLMLELAKRGHEVTVIAPYQPKNEPANYRTIKTEETIEATKDFDLYEMASASLFTNIKGTYLLGNMISEATFGNKGVQELLRSDEHFDLVIVEQFFTEALKAVATHFKAPLALFVSMGINEWNINFMGNPVLPSINAQCYGDYTNEMTFFQRVNNLIGIIYNYLYREYVFYPIERQYLKKYFPGKLKLEEVINNASLMLINSHVTSSENTLLTYNMIEIGGFHVIQNPLDKDIKEYLDSATDGAILFSLGSNLRTSDLSEEYFNALFRVFGRLKQKVLWKFEKDMPNKPTNIMISKWIKQRDVLAHPKIKLFITHGGLLSTIESIYSGVPMVGIPVFADQRMNMARAKKNGVAEVVPFLELTEENLSETINKVLNDPKYKENAKKLSSLMQDRVVKPLDHAMYWLEYVIRHRGFHFETAAAKLTWYEMYMVDILVFLVGNVVVVFLLTKWIFSLSKKLK